jgi:CPA1 family monovalent cation:H+ antiporter
LDWLTIFAVNIAGVRGAVTLAGVLSIPLLLPNGAAFPGRDLAITLATGVILCSMLIAAVGLPILLKFHKVEDHGHAIDVREARVAAIQSTIEAMADDEDSSLADRSPLMAYRLYLRALQEPSGPEQARNAQLAHKKALVAERKTIQAMRKARKIDDITARQLLGELDMIEAASMYRPLYL